MEPKLIKAIYLPIDPPTRTAQQKGVRVVHGHPHFYEKKEVSEAKAILKDQLLKFVPDEPIKGAVRIDVTFAFGTKDKKKVRGEFRTTRPDLDNLFKGLADCLTDLGFWEDDSQIVSLMLRKLWVPVEDAHLSITVSEYVEVEDAAEKET